nr:EOG090X0AVB [Eulimnadia texana]
MLYLIGLGLGDVKDITVKGLEIVRKAQKVYLESYTSILTVGKEALEEFYGREVIVADRDLVEQGADEIVNSAKDEDVAFLVVGDPLGATTHTDLILRAKEAGVSFQVVHNASILNAAGCCGLQLYSFGETVSIPFWTDEWKPSSFYGKILANQSLGLHTLCLLDIKVKEQTIENMMKKRPIYEPPRFMSVAQAAQQLSEIIETSESEGLGLDTVCIGMARVGWPDQRLIVTTLRKMKETDLGPPLHSLVIPGKMHPLEIDFIKMFADESVDLQSLCHS